MGATQSAMTSLVTVSLDASQKSTCPGATCVLSEAVIVACSVTGVFAFTEPISVPLARIAICVVVATGALCASANREDKARREQQITRENSLAGPQTVLQFQVIENLSITKTPQFLLLLLVRHGQIVKISPTWEISFTSCAEAVPAVAYRKRSLRRFTAVDLNGDCDRAHSRGNPAFIFCC